MTELQKNTEEEILMAAQKVFLEKGFDGASMQMIADEAGINKALLHYYFRSKSKLFENAFLQIFGKLIPPLLEVIASDNPFDKKIELFVDQYIRTIQENPLMPVFILHELTRNPEVLLAALKGSGINPALFIREVEKEIKAGNLAPVNPRELMINLLALCIFPFAGKPLLTGVFFDGDKEHFEKFIEERKRTLPQFIMNAIKKR